MTKTTQPTPGWVLTYTKTSYSRRFPTLQAVRRANVQAAARFGTRWLSLKPER